MTQLFPLPRRSRPEAGLTRLPSHRRISEELGREIAPVDPLPSFSDQELVQRALEGEEPAFAALVARYHRRAFWVAYHVVGRIEEARDVVQEAFVRLHRSLQKFDFSRSFYTWFYRIVMNLAIDSLRKVRASRQAGVDGIGDALGELPSPGEAVDAPVERDEVRSLVWRVLEAMDHKFRAVLVLRDIHGMSCRQIAPVLGVTHATVRWRLHRGRQIFREHWERVSRSWHG